MNIRQWSRSDLQSIQEVALATGIDTYESFIPRPDIEKHFRKNYGVEALERRIATPNAYGFVGDDEGRIGGFLLSSYEPSSAVFTINSLYVLPAFQGKGLGAGLLEQAAVVARRCGVDRTWIGVITKNTQAHAWYIRHGFLFVREEPYVVGSTTVHHFLGYRMIVGDNTAG